MSTTQTETKSLVAPPRLRYPPAVQERFNIDQSGWKALVEAIFPNATSSDSVVLALAYCRERQLDVFKRQCHIVPIWDKTRGCLVDTVWPGISELRATAFRTGQYAGRDPTSFGATITAKVSGVDVTYPEWAQITVYRLVGNHRVPFPGARVYWQEAFGRKKGGSPNEMWAKRPSGQLEKCAEAAALRGAFPEEIGNDLAADEVGGWDWHGRAAVAAESEASEEHIEQARQLRGAVGRPEGPSDATEPPFNPPTPEEQGAFNPKAVAEFANRADKAMTAAEGPQVDPAVDEAEGVDEPTPKQILERSRARLEVVITLKAVDELKEDGFGTLPTEMAEMFAADCEARKAEIRGTRGPRTNQPADGELFPTAASATEQGE